MTGLPNVLTVDQEPAEAVRVETIGERCDHSGHQSVPALVKVEHDSGKVLTLCGHHYARHADILIEQGFYITEDARHTLTANRAKGTNHA